ncbi:guanine nucleotide binding protein, alpha subunit [Mycena capillaripes]|nr:guanine nucleotide binding protein, alpha subunit [Mycena capillaripes]
MSCSLRKLIAKARSYAIERQIMKDCKHLKKECKILLLGSHESGKRTIVKRMEIAQQDFDAHELGEYRTMIYRIVLEYAGTLARAVHRVGVGVLEEGERTHASLSMLNPVFAQTNAMLTPALAEAIWRIARTPVVERLFDDHPTGFYPMDTVLYFFDSVHRIAAPTYVPSEEDILHASTNSTTVIETRLSMGNLSLCIIDVAEQRAERKKWIHCFESVTSIIFCAALSDYGQVLKGRNANGLLESIYLFDSVVNSRWFLRTSVILFLTKIDAFKQKLTKIPLGRYFPEYVGGNDVRSAIEFILWRFLRTNHVRLSVYPHFARATDEMNIHLLFTVVKETILQNALKDSDIHRDLELL